MLQTFHWLIKQVFLKVGFKWETRRHGDLKLGLWKINFSKTAKKGGGPALFPRRVVLMPGFGDTPVSWLAVLVILVKTIRRQFDELVLIDFPGFRGFLSQANCPDSMDVLKSATFDLLDSLKPHTIIGHSLGGWLGASYAIECGTASRPALKHPAYLGPDAVVLVDPAGVCDDEDEWERWRNLFDNATRGKITLRPLIFAKEPRWLKWAAPEFSNFITRKDVAKFINSLKREHCLENKLHLIRAKTWLIWGEDDALIPSRWMRGWLKELPSNTGTFLIPRVGHTPHIESPRRTAAIMAGILSHCMGN